jgi:hypothetical protein
MTELSIGVSAVTVNGVRYPVETDMHRPEAGGLEAGDQAPKWLGGGDTTSPVLTNGHRIHVPKGALLAFQTEDPIRLRGYSR